MITIRKFTEDDVADLRAMCLRQDDIDELLASDPELSIPDHLVRCVDLSEEAWLVLDGALIVAVYGLAVTEDLPGVGIPWLVATDRINLFRKQFIKTARIVVTQWLYKYAELTNLVSLYHVRSIVWLTRCLGFELPLQRPTYQGDEAPFLYFTKKSGGDSLV